MKRLKISAISYLNTAPLMWDFECGELREKFELSYTVPSACAEQLRTGTADIGIIPSITYQAIPGLLVIPGVAIAAKGPVRSIVLVSKKSLTEIKAVATDKSSRTSVALLEILFRKGWLSSSHAKAGEGSSPPPRLVPHQPGLQEMLHTCDAALLIGDPALAVDRKKYHVWDLAEEWSRHTGKPFVFAFWAVRRDALKNYPGAGELARQFQQSRDHGREHIDDLAREWSAKVGITPPEIRAYLSKNIDYSLDSNNLQGYEFFINLCLEYGLIHRRVSLEMLYSDGA